MEKNTVSMNREEDIYARKLMLEAMEICLRTGQLEAARSIGESSRTLKNRIDIHDYSKEDKWAVFGVSKQMKV